MHVMVQTSTVELVRKTNQNYNFVDVVFIPFPTDRLPTTFSTFAFVAKVRQ